MRAMVQMGKLRHVSQVTEQQTGAGSGPQPTCPKRTSELDGQVLGLDPAPQR